MSALPPPEPAGRVGSAPPAPVEALLLMPGLDGTGQLFSRLLPELEHAVKLVPVAYPVDRVLGLEALAEHARSFVPAGAGYAIVAESFSGPVALRLAAAAPERLKALILVASFVRSPTSWVSGACLRVFADAFARLRPPRWSTARWLTGGDVTLATELQTALDSVRPSVVAARLRLLARIDARRDLMHCPVPLLYLAGELDRLVAPACSRELATFRPDVVYRNLPAPHLVLQAQPRLAAAEILRFLAGLKLAS